MNSGAMNRHRPEGGVHHPHDLHATSQKLLDALGNLFRSVVRRKNRGNSERWPSISVVTPPRSSAWLAV
jgi:hypothetical protein